MIIPFDLTVTFRNLNVEIGQINKINFKHHTIKLKNPDPKVRVKEHYEMTKTKYLIILS